MSDPRVSPEKDLCMRPSAVLHVELATQAVDDTDFSLGIVRLCPHQEVVYVNRAVRAMAGDEIRVGTNLLSLQLDEPSTRALRTAFHVRYEEQRGSSYRIRFKRRDLGTMVRILVSAVPEYDAQGTLIGAIGFLIDESVDAVTAAVHHTIATATDCFGLLTALHRHLRDLIRFDTMIVSGVSRNRQHMRRIFEAPPPPQDIQPKMWWPMPPFLLAMIENFDSGPLDLDQMFSSPEFEEFARSDPSVKQFRDRGFRRALRFGVYHDALLTATVSLLRRDSESFTCADYERCSGVPIAEAVATALNFERHRDMRFGVDFINKVSELSGNLQAVAQALVDQIAQHHKWEHVSLFRIDREGSRLSLFCQAAQDSHRLPEGFSLPVTLGLIGKAYRDQQVVKAGDVRATRLAKHYQEISPDTRSEMVLPVPGTQGRWLLNIESRFQDAFADDEQQSVEVQLRVAGFILERMAASERTVAVVNSVADAVFQTNELGVILEANPAAERLLGRPSTDLLHRNLASYIALERDDEPVEAGVASDNAWKVSDTTVRRNSPNTALVDTLEHARPVPVGLLGADGARIPVLMSGASLPDRLGGKVFVASDLRTRNQIQKMEVLKTVFKQFSSEIRLPLSLAGTFLKDALETTSGAAHELVDKTLRQVRKAETSTERMLRLANDDDEPLPRQAVPLWECLTKVIAELPASDAEVIRLSTFEPDTIVKAARHELMFCIRSLLAYLLRRRAQVESVEIVTEHSDAEVRISLALASPQTQPVSDDNEDPALADLELSKSVIKDLMRRMCGVYRSFGEPPRAFCLSFPTGDEVGQPARHS